MTTNASLERLVREELAEHEDLRHEHRLLAIGAMAAVLAYVSARYADRRRKHILSGELFPGGA